MNPYHVLELDEAATAEEIDERVSGLLLDWTTFRGVPAEMREQKIEKIIWAYKRVTPMIPLRSVYATVSLQEANYRYLDLLPAFERIFYQSVIDYYAMPLAS